jgi:hypothetical protein
VSKDKKKKKKDKKDKKAVAGSNMTAKLDALTQNPVVAEIVSAALVAMASALKDSKRARRLATEAGDEITKLTKKGAERGDALWDMALQVGRRSLETLAAAEPPKRAKSKASAKKSPAKRQAPKRATR